MRRFSWITLTMTAALCSAIVSLFGAGGARAQTAAEKTLILGAGSTFAAPLYGAWTRPGRRTSRTSRSAMTRWAAVRGSTVSSPGPPTSQARMRR